MSYTLADILQTSDYSLTIFTAEEIAALELYDKRGKPYLRDFASNRERPAKPEEIVRQLFLYRLMNTYRYPASRISVEKGVQFGASIAEKRADIVVHDKDDPTAAYIIVEVKKPKRKDGLEQLKSYCNAEGAPIAVWTNGGEEVVVHRVAQIKTDILPEVNLRRHHRDCSVPVKSFPVPVTRLSGAHLMLA